MKIEGTKKELEYLYWIIERDIDDFYDDPYGIDSNDSYREIVDLQKEICIALDINYNEVVQENSTQYERDRMQQLIKGE